MFDRTETLTPDDGETTFLPDVVPPEAAPAADIVAEATSPDGAVVTFALPAVTDDFDPTPVVTAAPASGGTFALGATVVTVTATDGSGNTASAAFTVTVRDTTAPTLTVPADLVVRCAELAADGRGCVKASDAAVSAWLGSARASDAADTAPALLNDAPAVFPVGFTTVTFRATDAGGANNNGVLFRYDAAGQQYIYNLSTAGWSAPATYQIVVTLDDGMQQTVLFSLR